MKQADGQSNKWSEPGIAHYLVVELVALGVIGIIVYQRTSGIVAIVPVLAGLAGALSSFGSILVIVAVAVCLNAPAFAQPSFSHELFADGILCAAVLGYVVANYRLQSLSVQIFPPDPRLREDRKPRTGFFRFLPPWRRLILHRRSPTKVTTMEIGTAVATLPVCAILALCLWLAIPEELANPGLSHPIWRGVVLAWLFGLVWLVSFGLLGYVRDRRMSIDEATLFLQDTLWAETRREQRRLNRWLSWQHRRETP